MMPYLKKSMKTSWLWITDEPQEIFIRDAFMVPQKPFVF
jgi:hypothetical protein